MKIKIIALTLAFLLLTACNGGNTTAYSKSKYFLVTNNVYTDRGNVGDTIDIVHGTYLTFNKDILEIHSEYYDYKYVSYCYFKIVDNILYSSDTWHQSFEDNGTIDEETPKIDKNNAYYTHRGLVSEGVVSMETYNYQLMAYVFSVMFVTEAHAKAAGMNLYGPPR